MLGFFKKLVSPFRKLKSALADRIRSLFGQKIDRSSLEPLEQLFYEADLGAAAASELTEEISRRLSQKPTLTTDELLAFIREKLLQELKTPPPHPLLSAKPSSPHVILVVGVNGSGKTTSIAKLAAHLQKAGRKVLLAAGDTFRAAAVEQLEAWGNRLGIDCVKAQPGSDPSAVAYDAISRAIARNIDAVLIDTAGRLQTKTDLMQELAKIRKVCQKQIPEAPHETLLVLDATVGQNAIDQAKAFHQFTPLTGLILTKLDGSAKGGIAYAIQRQLQLPILWVGLGEDAEDFIPFDPKGYVDALLGIS